ncbi:MAG TPA: hypothetical protein VLB90_07880 [Pseudomonadales bacterium]|nr:hypothetical protein [Pseudomonadales bacterium]
MLDTDELLNGSDPLLADTDGDGLSDLADPAPIDKLGVLQEINGDGAGEKWAVALAAGDIDNDGIDDVLVGTPYDRVYTYVNEKQIALSHAGTVRVYSGADGQEIVASRISGAVANQRLGAAIAVVPDQNSDGKPDIAVGEPLANVATFVNEKAVALKGAGRVALYSGATGAFIRIVAEGKKAGDRFGSALAVGNVNGAGSDDLIVGAPMADVQTIINSKLVTLANAGQVTAFDGISDVEVYHRDGTQKNASFGSALAMDIDDHLLVGEPLFDVLTVVNSKNVLLANAGRVQMFAGDNGVSAASFILEGTVSNDWLGSSLAAVSEDINADGQADWLVGVPRANITTQRNKPLVKNDAGKVMLLSGQSDTSLLTMTGTLAADRLGVAVVSGDFDGDGTPDLVLGASQFDVSTTVNAKIVKLSNAGRAMVYSGAVWLP